MTHNDDVIINESYLGSKHEEESELYNKLDPYQSEPNLDEQRNLNESFLL